MQHSKFAIEHGSAEAFQLIHIVNYVRKRIELLPSSFGSRFLVDSALIHAIAAECSKSLGEHLNTLAPKYSREWGHHQLDLACCDGGRICIDIVHVAGSEDLRSIDLLDYPWLCHELGHYVHSHSTQFLDLHKLRLNEYVAKYQSRGIADRGATRERTRTAVRKFESVWTPTPDHRNWAHEIAADIFGIWLCGPAYIATFCQYLFDHRPSPYRITQAHPPYEIRALALLEAAVRLGWHEEIDELTSYCDECGNSSNKDITNEYLFLKDKDLINETVSCALICCNNLRIPRCNQKSIDDAQEYVSKPKESDFGSKVILAAWIANSKLDNKSFEMWQEEVVAELHDALTREFR